MPYAFIDENQRGSQGEFMAIIRNHPHLTPRWKYITECFGSRKNPSTSGVYPFMGP